MKLFFALLTFALSFAVNAGDVTAAGTITLSGNGGPGIVIVTVNNSTYTACSPGNRYWFKPDTDYNRAMLSMLLAAQMSGKRVYLTGTGSCTEGYPYDNALRLANITLMND